MSILPAAVTEALVGSAAVGHDEQAFPLLTADEDGQPRAMLLSRAELATSADEVLAVLRPSSSRRNLERTGRATLLVVVGASLHSVGLVRRAEVADGELLGVALACRNHKDDTLGIPLGPMSYRPTPELLQLEHWERSASLLQRLREVR